MQLHKQAKARAFALLGLQQELYHHTGQRRGLQQYKGMVAS